MQLASAQLTQTTEALCKVLPKYHNELSKRAAVIADQLSDLETQQNAIRAKLATRQTAVSVVADSVDFVYLTSNLNGTLHTIEEPENAERLSTAIEEFQPQLLMFRRNAPTETTAAFVDSTVPSVAIDLCEKGDNQSTFIERLTANIQRLAVAVEAID